jgi:hypothetical protein
MAQPNRIEIIINSGDAATDGKKTPAFPRRRPDPYGRRRFKDGIRFFDCGSVLSGIEYVNLAYVDSLSATPLVIASNGAVPQRNTMTQAEYLSLRDAPVIAVDRADWTSTFRQISSEQTDLQYAATVVRDGVTYTLDA